MKRIAAIILAAGSAKRFGSNKLLEPLTIEGNTLPLLAHTIKPWLQSFSVVNIVVNTSSDELQKKIEVSLHDAEHRLKWLACKDAAVGMGASLSHGIQANAEADGWLIGLGDMPLIPEAIIAKVKEALVSGSPIVAPYHEHKRGHPVGFLSGYREELMQMQHDSGARDILVRDYAFIHRVDSEQSAILFDIDTAEDLALCQQHLLSPHS